MFSRCLGLACGLLLIGTAPAITAAPVPVAKDPPRWEPLLTWLPEDTETLIVAPRGFEIPKEKAKDEFAGTVQTLPAGPLMHFKDELLDKQLRGAKVLCAVEGSRRFTAPGDLGMMPYEGCHILQFDPGADADLKRIIQKCRDKADKTIKLAGAEVAVFTEKQEQDTWSYFVCRPRPGILIIATNRDYLEETLKRIDKPSRTRALPADLPEWKHVDVKARLWAIRHYRKEFAKDDPSSPLVPQAAANVPDLNAVGFVFWIGGDENGNVATVRYLTDAKEGIKIATSGWQVLDLKPKLKQVAPEVIEITTSLSTEETETMFLFVLLMRLGHGIYC